MKSSSFTISNLFSKGCQTLSLGLVLAGTAEGGSGPAPKSPVPDATAEAEAEGLFGGIGLEFTTGYDSHYVFRGELLQKNTAFSELSYDLEINDALSLNITPWFLLDTDDDYTEFDLTSALTLTTGAWEWSVGYAGYYYPRGGEGGGEGLNDEQEMSVSVARDLGWSFRATALAAYSFTRDGYYFEGKIERPIEVTNALTLTPSVVVGADTDYFDEGTDFNHLWLLLEADYKLTPWCSLRPYVAGNFPFGHLDDTDLFFGGVKLTVTF